MAELAAHALRTLAFDDVANQDAAHAAGAVPLLIQQLNSTATAGLHCPEAHHKMWGRESGLLLARRDIVLTKMVLI